MADRTDLAKATYTLDYETKGKEKHMTVSKTPVAGCLLLAVGAFFILGGLANFSGSEHVTFGFIILLLGLGVFFFSLHLLRKRLRYTIAGGKIEVTQLTLLSSLGTPDVQTIKIDELEMIRVTNISTYVGEGQSAAGLKLEAVLKSKEVVELTGPMYDEKTVEAIERFIMVRSGLRQP